MTSISFIPLPRDGGGGTKGGKKACDRISRSAGGLNSGGSAWPGYGGGTERREKKLSMDWSAGRALRRGVAIAFILFCLVCSLQPVGAEQDVGKESGAAGALAMKEDAPVRELFVTMPDLDKSLSVAVQGQDKETTSLEPENEVTENQHGARHLNIATLLRWKDRDAGRVIIPYSVNSSFNDSDKDQILSALKELETRTGCLRFVKRTRERHYISVVSSNGCFSALGLSSRSPQVLSLGRGCMRRGIIQHEFMHALGFGHEQNRPDRDSYVQIRFENIKSDKRHNFELAGRSSILGSPYEYASVMHYGQNFFTKNNRDTIVPTRNTNGVTIGQREQATTTDVKKIKLLYQCERGIVRNWNDLNNSPCTSNCKCQSGNTGCGSNDNACHGSLVCSNNRCVTSSGPTPTPPTPTPPTPTPSPSSRPYLIWQKQGDEFYCIDLKARDTTNGNEVWYYPCNSTPAQYWYIDSNNYFRSSVDRNKCLVGEGGSSDYQTGLMIYDCLFNDDRFRWVRYTDNSIRPRNNNKVCIEPDVSSGFANGMPLLLDNCFEEYKEFKLLQSSSRRRKLPQVTDPLNQGSAKEDDAQVPPTSASSFKKDTNRNLSSDLSGDMDYNSKEDCEDSPVGWYDMFGRNCAWYGEDESNCEVYGDSYKNFGKTAITACCVCGGGPSGGPLSNDAPTMDDAMGCWDEPDWYDSTGDGCDWYGEGTNCEDYGNQFMSAMSQTTADQACCACGGGFSQRPASDALSSDTVPGCSDSPFTWIDEDGDDCDWYAQNAEYCDKYGDTMGYKGLTANEVCCTCGGGFDPNKRVVDDPDPSNRCASTSLSSTAMAALVTVLAVVWM